jgi:hypothetical protein
VAEDPPNGWLLIDLEDFQGSGENTVMVQMMYADQTVRPR